MLFWVYIYKEWMFLINDEKWKNVLDQINLCACILGCTICWMIYFYDVLMQVLQETEPNVLMQLLNDFRSLELIYICLYMFIIARSSLVNFKKAFSNNFLLQCMILSHYVLLRSLEKEYKKSFLTFMFWNIVKSSFFLKGCLIIYNMHDLHLLHRLTRK